MKKLILLCGTFFVLVAAAPALADGLHLDKVIVNFAPDKKPIENITVTNKSERALKVTVKTVQVIHSGVKGKVEEETDQLKVAVNTEKSDSSEITPPVEEETGQLIAAPKSFELDAGESRVVRLVLRKFSDDMEDIYRVRFLPDKPALEKIEELGGTSVQVNVVVSMGALIMAAPKEARPDLKFVRNDDTITFTNAGNVTAQLQREEFCTEDRKVCTPLEGQRIFPGARWIMTIPDALKDKEFSQTMLVNGSYSTLSYPAP